MPCSPFVTGLVDKCEAAMAATDPMSTGGGGGGVGVGGGGASKAGISKRQYVFSGELVRGTQFYGYSEEETVFVRMLVHTTRHTSHVTRHTFLQLSVSPA